ncbi:MAG: DUF4124 domain-containing protein [Gammaproteobacteria bacterium]|nr:DUF4124 domain-containing protein [Gammaproteobacteria bacterium]
MNHTARVRAAAWAGVLCVVLLPGARADTKVYRWVDDHGVVHYGDQIPPKYASRERDVVNSEGVVVERMSAQETPEQLAADRQKRIEQQDQQNRDRNLLNTYVSVGEIERLRDQRLALLADQVKVTDQFLDVLNGRLARLEGNAARYRPYAADPHAAPMPDQLADDLVRVTLDIRTQQQNLLEKQAEAASMSAQFAADIKRFKELKGIH